MVYVQTLIDNFNDGTIDEAVRWEITQGPGATESGGTLNMPCNMNYPRVEGQNLYNLSHGILAAKLSTSGTREEATEFYIGAHDGAGNHISAMGAPNGAFITFQPGGATTFNTEVKTDLTVGVGWDWVEGTWWGLGNLGADNILKMYNSTDGQTWNEMARCTVGGTFGKTTVGLVFMSGIWNGELSDLVAEFDDASFWSLETAGDSFHPMRIRSEGGWVYGIPKARVGGAWVPVYPKPKVDGVWNTPT